VTTQNVGEFSIGFADLDGGYTFFNEAGGTTLPVSAIEGSVATALVDVTWTDNRADGERAPYSISLGADALTSSIPDLDGTGTYTISSFYLAIVQIDDTSLPQPSTLDVARTVFESGPHPAAGSTSLQIVLRLQIPASSYPTTYSTTLHLQVTHGDPGP
jgi:hypothetical protein